jgi:hypothetical protein
MNIYQKIYSVSLEKALHFADAPGAPDGRPGSKAAPTSKNSKGALQRSRVFLICRAFFFRPLAKKVLY